MIDFTNARLVKLGEVEVATVEERVAPPTWMMRVPAAAAAGARDQVMFTNKRIIAVNRQGLTGSKVDISSLPYSKIQAFSIETAGTFDRDAELEMYFSGLGKVRLEFSKNFNLSYVAKLIAGAIPSRRDSRRSPSSKGNLSHPSRRLSSMELGSYSEDQLDQLLLVGSGRSPRSVLLEMAAIAEKRRRKSHLAMAIGRSWIGLRLGRMCLIRRPAHVLDGFPVWRRLPMWPNIGGR